MNVDTYLKHIKCARSKIDKDKIFQCQYGVDMDKQVEIRKPLPREVYERVMKRIMETAFEGWMDDNNFPEGFEGMEKVYNGHMKNSELSVYAFFQTNDIRKMIEEEMENGRENI